MNHPIRIMTMLALVAVPALASADEPRHKADGHHAQSDMAGMHSGMHAQMHKKGAFMASREVDGYQVTFHIMKAPAGQGKGGSHHLMIKVAQHGKTVNQLLINSKVVHPGEQSESKMMMRMGDWYMAAYDLGHPGDHRIMVLFKTPDGKKHFTGIVYTSGGAKP